MLVQNSADADLGNLTALLAPLADTIHATGMSDWRGGGALTASGPCRGQLWDGQLMVVGRAVNGWDEHGWSKADAADPVWSSSQAASF